MSFGPFSRPNLIALSPGGWRRRVANLVFAAALACRFLVAPSVAAQQEPAPDRSMDNHLSDRAELDRVIDVYHSGQYEACVSELERRLNPQSEVCFVDVVVIEKGRLYLASCALLAGDQKRSREVLYAALERNPLMAPPDSLTFPPPVVTLFLEVRDQIQGLIAEREQQEIRRQREIAKRAREAEAARKARETQLLELASEETLVTANHRIVAFLPFGAGQYQNGQKALGDFFLATELGLGVLSIASGLILTNLYARGLEQPPRAADNSTFEAAHVVLTVSSWSLIGVATVGILEANLNYQPFRRIGTRKRGIPPPPAAQAFSILPWVTPMEGGAFLGALGQF